MSDTDLHLIDQFRTTGQQKFLQELLQRHLASVRNLAFQMLLDHDAADDVTQDVFVRVVRGIDRFEGRSEFSTWLFRVAVNTVRSEIEKRGRSLIQSHEELPEHSAVTYAAPDGPVLQAELTTEIQAAMAELKPQLRAAIVLIGFQGKSATEAAEIEGCSTDTMYWRLHEARRQLKQLLAEHL